jgi:alpha-mannosidase
MYFVFEKIRARINDLNELRYRDAVSITEFFKETDEEGEIGKRPPEVAVFPDPNQDQGEHRFTYSLYPHLGGWLEGKTVQEAWDLNNPLTYISGKKERSNFSMFSAVAEHIMFDAVKKSEDEDYILVRLHEYTVQRGKVKLESDLNIESW